MRQVVLEIEEDKFTFFMEVLKNFSFVNLVGEDKVKKKALEMIAEGMQSASLASRGKIKTRSAKEFLHEL